MSKRIFLLTLDRYVVTRGQFIFGGDCNCLLDLARDKPGGNATLGGTGASQLTSLLTRHYLVDIWRKQHASDLAFTWQNMAGTIWCRLDRFYVSSSLVDECVFTSAIITYPYSDHDIIHITLTVDRSCTNVGPGVWKLNTSILKDKSVHAKVARFWSNWKSKKKHFSNVGEWWDTGKARVKDLLISCGKKLSATVKQRRACLLNKFRRLHAQSVLSDHEVAELDDVKSQIAGLEFRRIASGLKRSGLRLTNSPLNSFSRKKENVPLKRLATRFVRAQLIEEDWLG